MPQLELWLKALPLLLGAAAITWVISVLKRNVTIVDTLWSLLFVIAAAVYATSLEAPGPRAWLMLALVSIWGLRLAAYLAWRNRGHEEDRRYQAIRRRNEPNFALKSLWMIFGFQAVLAWVISLPLAGAAAGETPLGALDAVGVALWAVGLFFEAVGDWQLPRFKGDPANSGRVMDRGLWRYTRHPNYFGDFCVWWGLYLIAGVGRCVVEHRRSVDHELPAAQVLRRPPARARHRERRPAYAEYVRRTNAFFPGPRRQ